MFGQNQVITAKYFDWQSPYLLKVTSIFYTLQGEGPFSGEPCVFVRLSHCHLQCKFCDTWFDSGDIMDFSKIVDEAIVSIKRFNEKHGGTNNELPRLFVITGGEPCLQPQLVPFIKFLHFRYGIRVQIETTGTIDVDIPGAWRTYVVCSPKLNARGKPLRISPRMLDRIDCMKCVVSRTDPLYNGIPEFVLKWRDDHPDRPVYVSPMNVHLDAQIEDRARVTTLVERSEDDERLSFWTSPSLDRHINAQNHEYAAELALRHRVRLSLQTHLYASLP